ncbi:hypothetical protein [Streptomyces fagopyri]|uniref:hypothetical protein n=1 Tax=Streptomyces fagopyri TaxID=2662397 RepID=UPI0033D2A5AD
MDLWKMRYARRLPSSVTHMEAVFSPHFILNLPFGPRCRLAPRGGVLVRGVAGHEVGHGIVDHGFGVDGQGLGAGVFGGDMAQESDCGDGVLLARRCEDLRVDEQYAVDCQL